MPVERYKGSRVIYITTDLKASNNNSFRHNAYNPTAVAILVMSSIL
jgi:hypothetical protein